MEQDDESDDERDIDFRVDDPTYEQMQNYCNWRASVGKDFKAWRVDFQSGLWLIQTSDSDAVYIPDEKTRTVSMRDANDFLADISMYDRAGEYFSEDQEERFNREFWQFPSTVYHGTSSIRGVMAKGIQPRSETRGLRNRSVGAAVFTTCSLEVAESYIGDSDGGVIAIDVEAMAADGRMPFVAEEPEVLEQRLLSAIANRIGVEWNEEYGDAGVDPDTVIFFGAIPKKYLSVVKL